MICQNPSKKRNFHSTCQKNKNYQSAPWKNTQKGNFHSTCQLPKKETSIPPVKHIMSFLCSPKKCPKRKSTCHLSITQKGNFHSTCQKFCSTFLLPQKTPKKEIFPSFHLSKPFQKRKYCHQNSSQKGNIAINIFPKKEIYISLCNHFSIKEAHHIRQYLWFSSTLNG